MKVRGVMVAALLMLAGYCLAQTTQPAGGGALELRATQAFNRGDYALALPMLKKLAVEDKDQPQKLGPINEQIRVCERNLANVVVAPQAAVPQMPQGEVIPTLPETRKPHAAPKPGQVLEMSIKELGNFEYDQEKGGSVPDDVKRLSGSMIRLRGFMIPMDQAENITQFALVPSLFACCFGQPPQVQHTVVVNCPKGKAVSYCPDEIVVEGKLNVQEKKDDGYVVSIFEVTVTSVKPAPR
jgi:hypothetical protein